MQPSSYDKACEDDLEPTAQSKKSMKAACALVRNREHDASLQLGSA